jgi:hypothetical protein
MVDSGEEDGSVHADPIASLFSILHASIRGEQIVNSAEEEINSLTRSLAAEERVIRRLCQTEAGWQLSTSLQNTVTDDGRSSLKRIRGWYLARRNIREQRIRDLHAQKERFASTIDFHISSVKFREALFHRQMRQNASSSLRRLQELLFEVLGEMAKASMRCEKYVERLQSIFDADIQKSQENLLWKRFIDRAQEDSLQQMHILDIGPQMNGSISYASKTQDDFPLYNPEMIETLTTFTQRLIADREEVPLEDVHVSRLLEVRYNSTNLAFRDSDTTVSRRRGRAGAHPVFDASPNTLTGKCSTIRDLSILMAQILVGAGNRRGRDPLHSLGRLSDGGSSEDPQDQSSPKLGSPTRLFRRAVPASVKELPMFSPHLLLSGKVLWWILSFASQPTIAQGGPSGSMVKSLHENSSVPLDTRIYYCVEEGEQNALDASTGNSWNCNTANHTFLAAATERALEKIYSSSPGMAKHVLAAKGKPLPMSVSELCGVHRQQNASIVQRLRDEFKAQDLTENVVQWLQAVPDVLECKVQNGVDGLNSTLHFAPASVLQLLQTPQGRDVMSSLRIKSTAVGLDKTYDPNYVRYGKVTNLYVVIPSEHTQNGNSSSPIIQGRIQPLSNEAIQEMLAVYVCRHPDQVLSSSSDSGGLPSAMHVFPDGSIINNAPGNRLQALQAKYTAIQNPSVYNSTGFTQQDGEEDIAEYNSRLELQRKPRLHFASTYDESWDEYNHRIRKISLNQDSNAVVSQNNQGVRKKSQVDSRVAYLFVQYNIAKREIDVIKSPAQQSSSMLQPSSKLIGSSMFESLLLPQMCWWRACLSPACQGRDEKLTADKLNPKKSHIVGRTCWHCSSLKDFLDAQSTPNSQSEAQRYLPKYSQKKEKALLHLSPQSKDLQMIKVSSTLLQELCTKKLSSTISSFCKKATNDASVHGKKLSALSKTPNISRLNIQKSLEASKLNLQECSQAVDQAKQLRDIEAKVTSDLKRLIELKAFPSAELAIIRKEQKALEQEKDLHASLDDMEGPQVVALAEDGRKNSMAGSRNKQPDDGRSDAQIYNSTKKELFDLELQFCMRKSLLLRQRVQEVEASIAIRGGSRGANRDKHLSM